MAFTQKPGRTPFLKTGHGLPSALKQIEKNGPGKKKPAVTFDPAQRIGTPETWEKQLGGPGASTGVFEFNRPKYINENSSETSGLSVKDSKKYAQAHNANIQNEVRWNTERQAKMDSTNTASAAKFAGLKDPVIKKLGNIAANKTRRELGGPNMPIVERHSAQDPDKSYGDPNMLAKSTDTYRRNKPFEVKADYKSLVGKKSPMNQKVSKKTAYDIKEASNQKLKPSARKHYAENAQAAMKNKKKK